MKYLISIISFLFIVTSSTFAQELNFEITTIDFDGEEVEVVQTSLEPGSKEVRDEFENYMDDTYSVDLDGKKFLFFDKGYIKAEAVEIPAISDKKITLYAKTSESEKGPTDLYIFASTGNKNWITEKSNPDAFDAMQEIAQEFTAKYLPEYYSDEVDNAKEQVADLEDDMKDIRDEISDNEKEIENKKEEIKDLEKKNEELSMKIDENKDNKKKAVKNVDKRKDDLEKVKKKVRKEKNNEEDEDEDDEKKSEKNKKEGSGENNI